MAAVAAAEPWWDTTPRDKTYVIGLDLGQSQDFSAIVVMERYLLPIREIDPQTGDQKTEVRHEVRHLERPLLGTPYPVIVARVCDLVRSLSRWEHVRDSDGKKIPRLISPHLVADATGVGRPVIDLLRVAKLNPVAVTITGGSEQTQPAHREFHVPKRDLCGVLQVAFQNRELLIAKSLPLASVLAAELANFRVKISLTTAHDSYESWRENLHDDLVLSTALAYWWSCESRRHAFAKSTPKGF